MKRLVTYLVVIATVVLAGCAHTGAIPKSPCACEFHTIPANA
jgi:hypothetical protein